MGTAGTSGKFDKKLYKKAADEAFKAGSIFSAADLYLEILKNDSTDKTVLYNLAESFYMAKDYDQAALYFYKAYKGDSTGNPTALYYAALCTKMQGKYPEAREMFRRFSKSYSGTDAVKMKKWARVEVDGCNFAIKETAGDQNLKLVHLGKEVNSNYADQAPAYRNDVLYFASIHSDTVLWMNKDMSDAKKEGVLMKLYTSKVDGDNYEPAERLKTFDQTGKHISNGSFSSDGNKFFYTICDGGSMTKPNCDIYMSELEGSDWGTGKKLNEEINLKGSTNTQPFLAKEAGGNEVLYFVSDREGGKGGLDIWYSALNKKGEFGPPKNAGNKVNTDRDEVTPFWDTKTNTLYFSSNGWINMGGYDIFKSASEGAGKYSTPENLGAPFNSPCNDYYYRFGKSNTDGYFVSNRPGIFSVRGKTCCDDIFEYKYVHKIDLAVKGHVIDETTQEIIPGAVVTLSLQSTDNSGDVPLNTDSIPDTRSYFFNLNAEKAYKATAVKDGYFTASRTFNTKGSVKSDTMQIDIYLKKLEKNKAYRLSNIYYDFDKADLRPASKATLDTLYNILMENPTIIIELSSHTDSRGNDQYNLDLSQKRAESCVNYLINEKGLDKARITAKGYGKSKPLEDCSKYPECPNDQSGDCPCHQLNRRTEFKIIGELEGKMINDNE